jgi:hypothetical protein
LLRCVFIATGMCVLSHCLAVIEGLYIYRHRQVFSGSTVWAFRC